MFVRGKLAPGEEAFIQDHCSKRKRPELSLSSFPLKQRDEEFLKPDMKLDLRPLVLSNGLTQRKSKLSHLSMTGESFTTWSKVSHRTQGNRGAVFHRDWKRKAPLSLIRYFKSMTPKSLRKTLLHCKTGKKFLKRFKSHRERERIYNYVFPEINVLRKRGSESYSQEEAHMKFS